MSPLVVGDDEAFKTMALCKHNKVYNQTVLFIAFFLLSLSHTTA